MEKEQTGGAETRVTMNNYTKEDIIRLVEEEDVEFIRLQFTDLFGNLKNIAVTASQLDRVLNNKCMFDGSAIDGFARIEESDVSVSGSVYAGDLPLETPAGQGGAYDL